MTLPPTRYARTIENQYILGERTIVSAKQVSVMAFRVVVLSFAVLAGHAARAGDHLPLVDPFFDEIGLRSRSSPVSAQAMAIAQNFVEPGNAIMRQINAIRDQITDEMSGAGAVDVTEIASLQGQLAGLEQQSADLFLEEVIQSRSLETPAQLHADALRHREHVAAYAREWSREHGSKPETDEDDTRDISPKYPYGDDLGYTRGATLTDAQSKEINRIEAASEQARAPFEVEFAKVYNEFADRFEIDGPVTFGQLAPIWRQKAAVKSYIAALRLDMMLQIRALLTPAQLANAARLHQEEVAARAASRDKPLIITGKVVPPESGGR